MRRAAARADWTAGSKSAIKTAMIAMTTSSSIRVKPGARRDRSFIEAILRLRVDSFVVFDDLDLHGILDTDASLIVLANDLPVTRSFLPL